MGAFSHTTIKKLIFTAAVAGIQLAFVCSVALSQNVSGEVTDAQSGETLPGVNILVKGTSTGASTDAQGHFELTIESLQDTLVVSFIGYQTEEVPVSGRTEIDISLQPQAITGEEMVVVGYGTRDKGELTGSVTNIQGASIEEAPEMNILQGLQGKVPGLKISNRGGEPGSESVQYTVRGLSTLGNNSPLIVIDGVPRESFSHLSPNDIESINILKDASAAIYGARAANGVINIKTKRGTAGKNQLRFRASYGISSFTRVPKMMNSFQWATYQNEIESRYGRQPLFTDEQLQQYEQGGALPRYPNTNMYEETFRDYAPETHYNLSTSGGNENVQYYLSGDIRQQEGHYKSKDMNYGQYQLRSNIDAQITNSLSVGLDLSGRLEKTHRPSYTEGGLFSRVQRSRPIEVAYFENGLPGNAGEQGENPVIISSDEAGWGEVDNNILQSKVSFDWEMDWLTQGLMLNGYGSFDFQKNNDENFNDIWNYYEYDVNNDEYVPQVGFDWQVGATRRLLLSESSQQDFFYHMRLNYEKSFRDHHFESFVAYEQAEGVSKFFNAFRRDLISDKKIGLWAGGSEGVDNDSNELEWGRQHYFGSLFYNYAGKYLLDATLRYDGSSTFAEGEKFGLFPGVSVGWNITEEPFMAFSENWLDNLKFRISWAKMGNDRVPRFQYLNQYSLNSYYIFGEDPRRVEGFVNSNTPNPNITWEESEMSNIGIDAAILDEKLSINLDYFYEKRRQILITRSASVPRYTALELPQENLGKVNNQGIELVLNYNRSANSGNLNYSIGGNLTYNKNKIVFMDEPQGVAPYREQEGHPIQSWVVYKTDGLYTSMEEIENSPHLSGTRPGDIKYVDFNEDGVINSDDRYRKYTSPIPEIQFGLNVGINYKAIELTAFFQGQTNSETLLLFDDLGNRPEFQFTKRWTEGNNSSDAMPSVIDRNDTYNARTSDYWLYDSSFLRLKNLVLAYQLPSEILQRFAISNARVYLNGSNLWTWDKIKHIDPEANNSQARYYPQLTKMAIGLEINF